MESGMLMAEGLDFDSFLTQLDSETSFLSASPSPSPMVGYNSPSMAASLIKPSCRASISWSSGASLHYHSQQEWISDYPTMPEEPTWKCPPPPDLLPPTPPFVAHSDDFMDLPALDGELAGFVDLGGGHAAGLSEEDRALVDDFLSAVPVPYSGPESLNSAGAGHRSDSPEDDNVGLVLQEQARTCSEPQEREEQRAGEEAGLKYVDTLQPEFESDTLSPSPWIVKPSVDNTAANVSDWVKYAGFSRESTDASATSSSKSGSSFTTNFSPSFSPSLSSSFSPSRSFSRIQSSSGSGSLSGASESSFSGGELQMMSLKTEPTLYSTAEFRTGPASGIVPNRNRFISVFGNPAVTTGRERNSYEKTGDRESENWTENWDIANMQGVPSHPFEDAEEIVRFQWARKLGREEGREGEGEGDGHREACGCGECQMSNVKFMSRDFSRYKNSENPYLQASNSAMETGDHALFQDSSSAMFQPAFSTQTAFIQDMKPLIISAAKPSRPADISERLAKIVGTLTSEEMSKASSANRLPVTAGAINAVTVRPPSQRARNPRNPSKQAVSSKKAVEKTDTVSQLRGPLGVRKTGRTGRPKKVLAVEEMSVKNAANVPFPPPPSPRSPALLPPLPAHPLSDIVLSSKVLPRPSSKIQVPDFTLKQQLIALAEAVATDDQARARFLTGMLKEEAKPVGSVMQRVAFHFMAALVARAGGTGSARYNAPILAHKEDIATTLSACGNRLPYMAFFFEAANAQLWDAVSGQSRVHIVDLGMWQASIYKTLMRQLALQPGAPPRLRITGVDAPWVGNPMKGCLRASPSALGRELTVHAAELGMEFEFHVVESRLENLRPFMIRQESGEVMAVISALRLQYLWDQSVVRSSPRDMVLQFVRQLNPKLFTFVDMEADLNGPFFLERFREALDHFHCMFDAQESAFHTFCSNRQRFETDYFGRDIINVVACEGLERVVRSEKAEKWGARLSKAGFSSVRFSPRVIPSIEKLLERYSEGFAIKESSSGLQLTWKGRAVMSTSAWRPSN